MGAQITLFAAACNGPGLLGPVAAGPFASHTSDFTSPDACVMRVKADGSPVVITINTYDIPLNTGDVEYFGLNAGDEVEVA